jgi:hypothetical protein
LTEKIRERDDNPERIIYTHTKKKVREQLGGTWKTKPTMVVPVFLNGGSLRPFSDNIAFRLQRSKLNPPFAGKSMQELFDIVSSLIDWRF